MLDSIAVDAKLILLPVFAVVFLTIGIGVWLGLLRYRAITGGELKISYFRFNRGAEPSERLARVSDNFDNLFALPLLFYLGVILIYISAKIETTQLALAWAFAISRYAHSYLHVVNNNVIHRFASFATGALIMTAMWALLLFRLLSA